MKALIFDSGPLINLSMNGLLYILEELKKNFDGKFLITEAVKREVIDKPANIEKYELGALRIQELLISGVLEMPNAFDIDNEELKTETRKLMDAANHAVRLVGKPINIVSEAEISCVALANQLVKQKIETLIAIDERTTRVLAENPENLERLMSSKLHHDIKIDIQNLREFHELRFIRSTEIVYVAFKKKLINLEGKKVLEALIYATKFKGSAISFEEIDELKKL